MQYLRVILASAVIAVLLVGCDGDNGEENGPVMPPAPATTDFQSFVQQLLASTAENTDPVPVDATLFTDQFVGGDPQPITFFRP